MYAYTGKKCQYRTMFTNVSSLFAMIGKEKQFAFDICNQNILFIYMFMQN